MSSSSPLSPVRKFDVFLNFRAPDTGKTFVSHLYRSLDREGFRTLKDEEELKRSEPMALDESNIAVVVISENYASSVWCLEVLAKIVQRWQEGSLAVVPVFYEVNPSDVETQRGRFAEDFERYKETEDPWKVKKWRDALTKLTQISPLCSQDWEDDSKFIEDITGDISEKILGSPTKDCQSWHIALPSKVPVVRTDDVGDLSRSMYGAFVREYEPPQTKDLLSSDKPMDQFEQAFSRHSSGLLASTEEPFDSNDPKQQLQEALLRFEEAVSRHSSGLLASTKDPFKSDDSKQQLEDALARIEKAVSRYTSNLLASTKAHLDYGKPMQPIEVAVSHNTSNLLAPTKGHIDSGKPMQPIEEAFPDTSSNSSSLVGIERHMKAMYPLLDLESGSEVRIIGISGKGGVGKTTLAKFVSKEVSKHFEIHCFLKDAKKIYQDGCSPGLLEEFDNEYHEREALTTWSYESRDDVIKARLGHRKVLLIADDVDKIEQLEGITKDVSSFGPGSRVILTTEDKSMLVNCGIEHVYEVQGLRYDEALQLFCQFAFNQKYAPDNFQRLSVRAVQLAGFLPLALRVFGSYLYGRGYEEWESALRTLEASQETGELSTLLRNVAEDAKLSCENASIQNL